MSCNTFIPIMDLVREVEALLAANYIDKDDPRITNGVFTNPTIREGFLLDVDARLEFCRLVQECGLEAPFGKMWMPRPLAPKGFPISYMEGDEIKVKWVDIDSVVTPTGYRIVGNFEEGAILRKPNEVLLYNLDGKYYRWTGEFPKSVPAASTPADTGGIGEGAWELDAEASFRSEITGPGGISKIGNAVIQFPSVAAMTAAAWTVPGMVVRTLSYYAGAGLGGGEYTVIAAATAPEDGFEYHNGQGVQYKLTLNGVCDVTQAGADGSVARDTAAITKAAVVAKVKQLKLLGPNTGKDYKLNAPVDLRFIHRVEFRENINTSAITNAIAVTLGGMARSGLPDIHFRSVDNGVSFAQPSPAQPVVRVFGAKSGEFTFGSCNYLQIYADAADLDGGSVAYSSFFLNGVVRKLELYGKAGYSWINENEFHRGRLIELSIISEPGYSNNHNVFYRPCFEGTQARIDMRGVWENRIEGARFEGVTANTVTFDADTVNNMIEGTWTGQRNTRNVIALPIVASDMGMGNIVSHADAVKYDSQCIIDLSSEHTISDGVSTTSPRVGAFMGKPFGAFADTPKITIGINTLATPANSYAILGDSGMVEVSYGDILQLTVDSISGGIRPTIQCFGADRRRLNEPDLLAAPSFTYSPTSGNYGSTAPFNTITARSSITDKRVAYVRCAFYTGTINATLRKVTWEIYSKRKLYPLHPKPLLRLENLPTSGVPKEGTLLYVGASKKTYMASVQHIELPATVGVDNPAITLPAPYTALVGDGDRVGLLLDDGTTYWGAVTDKAGATIKIGALPSAASAGNPLYITRWVDINPAEYTPPVEPTPEPTP